MKNGLAEKENRFFFSEGLVMVYKESSEWLPFLCYSAGGIKTFAYTPTL